MSTAPRTDESSSASEPSWPQGATAWAGRHPWWWLGLYEVVTAALYQWAIRAPLYTPFRVAATAIDRAIPLVPETAGPYLSYFLLMPSFVWFLRRRPDRGAWLMAAGFVVLGNLVINLAIPTEIAEPLRPEDAGGWLLAQIISGDTPRAALPSGHVTLPVALAALSFAGRMPWRWLYAVWAAMLGVVILTTKQHHFPDAIGGLVWGLVGSFIALRVFGLGARARAP